MRDDALGKSFQVGAYHVGEEIAHAVTHGAGLLLSIAGLIVLIAASLHADVWCRIAASVFGVTLILVYASSTLYHAIPHLNAKLVLRRLDQAAVFLLIAGTYTPFSLGPLRQRQGWLLCAIIWGLALGGILLQNTAPRLAHRFSLPAYLAMGWIGVLVFQPLAASLHPDGLRLLFGGGIAYTIGTGFYAMPVRYAHAVWHVFVMAGSLCHFACVLGYVIPPV
jgi:hemolysin III